MSLLRELDRIKDTQKDHLERIVELEATTLDNDRIIKLGNMYCDEAVATLRRELEFEMSETKHKVQKMDRTINESIEKLNLNKFNKDEVGDLRAGILRKVEKDMVLELKEFKSFS